MASKNFFSDVEETEDFIKECFDRYRSSVDEALRLENVHELLNELFVKSDGSSYSVSQDEVEEIFSCFDLDADGRIDFNEFQQLSSLFIFPVLKPKCALIVIDVQNDFIDGTLSIRNCPAGQDGKDVVPVINDLLSNVNFHQVFYTYDWHPDDHVSFIDNVCLRKFHENSGVTEEQAEVFDIVVFEGPPIVEQKLWPKHCVQNSWGSELHPDLKVIDGAKFVYKGTNSDIDSYSAFWDNQKFSQTELHQKLQDLGVTDVFVCGLALDYCVGYTAMHSLEHGYRTILIEDACRGVDHYEIKDVKEKLLSSGGIIVSSTEVQDLVSGKDRRPDLGRFIAKYYRRSVH